MDNYILEYRQAIKDGKKSAGKWVNFLLDLIADKLKKGEYLYDHARAEHAVNWIETHCFHTVGFMAQMPFLLEPWEKAVVAATFGIINPKDNKRQFREVVIIIARKNGKTLLAAAIAKYVLCNGGFGTRVYCTAPKLDQADLVYDGTWNMFLLDPAWQKEEDDIRDSIKGHNRKTYDDSGHAKKTIRGITINKTNSLMKKQAFSDRKNDGFDPSLVICDEIASWKGEKGLRQYEVWKSACGAREMGNEPSIILSCSTAGYENDSIYDELMKRATRFLLGDSKETKLLPFLFVIDEIDDWNDMEELRKSNPNLGVSVSEDYLREELTIAEGSLSKKAEFITKYCCLKQNSSTAWLSTQTVQKCMGPELKLEDFAHNYCVGGIDLSQTTDLTAACVLIEKEGEIYVFHKYWLPSERIDEASERDGVPYRIYIERGLLEPSGDNFVDYRDCYNWFTHLIEDLEILPLKVGYDRYSAQYLVQDMKQYGIHMDDVWQGENLWSTLQTFEGLCKDGKIHIGDNDITKAHLLNSAIKMSVERGRGKLVKVSPNAHIDGVAAIADALVVREKWYSEIGVRLKNER